MCACLSEPGLPHFTSACCNAIMIVPSIIFAIGVDGKNCYVADDELWTSTTHVKGVMTWNVAATWRLFFLLASIVHGMSFCFSCAIGNWDCRANPGDGRPYGGVLLYGCTICCRIGLLIWGTVLRAIMSGRVAAGKMIYECQ